MTVHRHTHFPRGNRHQDRRPNQHLVTVHCHTHFPRGNRHPNHHHQKNRTGHFLQNEYRKSLQFFLQQHFSTRWYRRLCLSIRSDTLE